MRIRVFVSDKCNCTTWERFTVEDSFISGFKFQGRHVFFQFQPIKEAGYSNGIFKTQVTLLNRRVGSEESSEDKLWIHEISPSRTEIRVVPLKNTVRPNKDLVKRYNLFVENGNFRDDTIYYVRNFIEGIDILNVVDSFIRSKGRIKDGRRYQRLIQKEFKVGSFDKLLNDIKDRYIESMNYFIEGSEWNITSNKYGKQKGE